jgi:hypothetical protein
VRKNMHRNQWLVAGIISAVIIAGVVWAMHRSSERAMAVVPDGGLSSSVTSPTTAGSDGEISSMRAANSPHSRQSIHDRYESSDDLFSLYQELRINADTGDAEALTTLADIEGECLMFLSSVDGGAYIPNLVAKRDPEVKPWVDSMLSRRRARCHRFNKADLGTLDQRRAQLERAAQEGSIAAKLELMSERPLAGVSDEELKTTVQQALASGNADTIARLSGVMHGQVADRRSLFDVPAGSDMASDAYILAACRLGMNCGSNSQLLANACLRGYGCGYPSFEAMLSEKKYSPIDMAEARRMAEEILAKIGTHS